MAQFYTYLHCKPDGSPFYVGKGTGRRAYSFTHSRNKFHRDTVSHYGIDNILVYIFECESETVAFKDEVQQINQLRTEGYRLANQTSGGEGSFGIKHREETKKKISASGKGRILSEETKKKMSASMTGKKKPPRSVEHQAKITAALRTRIISSETREKLRLANIGRTFSDDALLRMSLSKMGNKYSLGHKHSDESKNKMSESIRSKKEVIK